MAPVLRGSQAWLSRETETIHVITGALMGEVQAARGMSSKDSQHEVGQDAQRTQAPNLLLVSTLWRVYGRTQIKEVGIQEKALWNKVAILIISKTSRKGDCVWYSASHRYPRENQFGNLLSTLYSNLS